jgi:hypothetical protein
MIFLSFLASVAMSFQSNTELCKGFLPENNLRIPATIFQAGGVTKLDFDSVLDQIEKYYAPIVAAKGGTLRVTRLWDSETVNASANRSGRTYVIRMYGGLARYPTITKDSFMLVACHEIGHHLGGAPKLAWDEWASNEGAADYYATLRCLRFLFDPPETQDFVDTHAIDAYLRTKCEEIYSTQDEENFCMRSGMAGLGTVKLFQELREVAEVPRFDTPDTNQVAEMYDDHPMPQCRLDTYFQGAVCVHNQNVELSDADPTTGTCSEQNGQMFGTRPRCWFKP